jgi:hypothetical protein
MLNKLQSIIHIMRQRSAAWLWCSASVRSETTPPPPLKRQGGVCSKRWPLLPIANPDFIFFIKKAHNMRPTIKARDGEFTWT